MISIFVFVFVVFFTARHLYFLHLVLYLFAPEPSTWICSSKCCPLTGQWGEETAGFNNRQNNTHFRKANELLIKKDFLVFVSSEVHPLSLNSKEVY